MGARAGMDPFIEKESSHPIGIRRFLYMTEEIRTRLVKAGIPVPESPKAPR